MTNKKYFFIGIGGIGMSSIAQYLHEKENIILEEKSSHFFPHLTGNLSFLSACYILSN